MASEVSICNLALAHLGDEATVTSIDPAEGSAQAEHCARFYPIARDTVLESHTWSFATRRIPLVELADETAPGSWGFVYQRPNDVMRSVAVLLPGALDDEESEEFVEESIEGDVQIILSNAEDAWLRYIVRVIDTTKYSALVVNAIARLLASMLAGPLIKGDAGMKIGVAQLERYEKVELPKAKAADANARKKDTYRDFVPSSIKARL